MKVCTWSMMCNGIMAFDSVVITRKSSTSLNVEANLDKLNELLMILHCMNLSLSQKWEIFCGVVIQVHNFWCLLFAPIWIAGRERWQNHSCVCWWSRVSSLQAYQGASTSPACRDPSFFWRLYPYYCTCIAGYIEFRHVQEGYMKMYKQIILTPKALQ